MEVEDSDPFPFGRDDVIVAVRAAALCLERNLSIAREKRFQLDLRGIKLWQQRLWNINLSNADLLEANLAEARLDKANLSDATLVWADLTGADLGGANMSGAELAGADFRDAHLNMTNFTSAVFARKAEYHPGDDERQPGGTFVEHDGRLYCVAQGLTQAQLDYAVADPERPPYLDHVKDVTTGKQLVWRGGPVPEST